MKRVVATMALTGLIGVLGIVPASADVGSNPNSRSVSNVSCEGGLTIDVLWAATPQNVVGHDLEGNRVGVATSIYATLPDGTPFPGAPPLFDRPGKGHDAITIWCTWPDELSPTGYAGADVIFNATLRP